MKYCIYILLAGFFLSCNERKKTKLFDKKPNVNDIRMPKSTNSSNPDLLIGYWRFEEDEFASMVIRRDSIYYPDHQSTVSYRRYLDMLLVFTDSTHCDTFKHLMKGRDTLILTIADFDQKYVRHIN